MPVIDLQVEQIKQWTEIWRSAPDRSLLTKGWRAIRDELSELSEPEACRKVSGPIGATIQTLKIAGWNPVQPRLWIGDGAYATLDASEPHGDVDIARAFREELEKKQWRQASFHFCGARLGAGCPSLAPARAARRRLEKQAKAEQEEGAANGRDASPSVDCCL